MVWVKDSKIENEQGTTISYRLIDSDFIVESRKVHIPHANGYAGTWDYTSYHIMRGGKEIGSRPTLKAAKNYAEEYQTLLTNKTEEETHND